MGDTHKRRTNPRARRWSWKKWSVILPTLAAASTLLQNSGHMVGALYDKLVPKSAPVTYAQIEALRVTQRWPTEVLPPTKDRVRVTVDAPDKP